MKNQNVVLTQENLGLFFEFKRDNASGKTKGYWTWLADNPKSTKATKRYASLVGKTLGDALEYKKPAKSSKKSNKKAPKAKKTVSFEVEIPENFGEVYPELNKISTPAHSALKTLVKIWIGLDDSLEGRAKSKAFNRQAYSKSQPKTVQRFLKAYSSGDFEKRVAYDNTNNLPLAIGFIAEAILVQA